MVQVSLKEIIESVKDALGDDVNEIEISTSIKVKLNKPRYSDNNE